MKDRSSRIITYQARWDKQTEKMRKKLSDNTVKLSSVPTDIIVCNFVKSDELNPQTIQVKDVRLTHIIFPFMKDVPIKHNRQEFNDGYVIDQLLELYGKDGEGKVNPIEINMPVSENLDEDDLIIRVLVSDDKMSTVCCYKVTQLLGSFSNNEVLTVKAKLTPVSESMTILKDERIVKIIKSIANRRLALGY